MSDVSKLLEKLSPEKRKLLELQLKKKGTTANSFPLSYAQRRLWFLYQLEPGSTAYHIPAAIRLKGHLNRQALKESLTTIIERHEILRTSFTEIGNQPMQVVSNDSGFDFEYIDLSGCPLSECEEQCMTKIREENAKPFNLSKGPLLRVRLYILDENEHILFFLMHHIISDGWSIGVFIHEFSNLYASFLSQRPANLPDLSVQYADFAKWQQKVLQGADRRRLLEYWKEKLGNGLMNLELPTDHPRPAVKSYRGGLLTYNAPRSLTADLKKLAGSCNTTMFTVLLSAFYVLLNRYTGQHDITIGTPIANRNRAEIEPLIGFFVNTIVLRADLSGNPDFLTVVKHVKEISLEAFTHQDLPFEMLVEELHPERSMNRTPLFQVMFAYQTAGREDMRLPALQVESIALENASAKFDLTLNVTESGGALFLSIEYDADLFQPDSVQRMFLHFEHLLEAITLDPEKPIARLPLLPEQEQYTLLNKWNRKKRPYETDKCLHEIFEENVLKQPDSAAVVIKDQMITFRELNRRANQLAHHLRDRRIGPENIVGLCCERSIEMIIGLLGILKSGAAYLPLDPFYPEERIAFMLEDAKVPVVVTQEALLDRFNESDTTIMCMDRDWPVIAQQPENNPDHMNTPENIAYVIYTSGTTGRPKGVMLNHKSPFHLAENLEEVVYKQQDKAPLRISLNAPLPFDASVQQLVMLMHGHTLDIIPQEIRGDGPSMVSYVRDHHIDVLDCVPSQLKLMLAAGLLEGTDWIPSTLLPGGEAIDPETWKILVEAPATDSYNMYGPTECTVDSTICPVKAHPEQPVIGKPVANARFYILDANLEPLPTGIPGELHIAGAGLARGYLNRPELTADKFIPDPFTESDPGARMYKTGDLARYRVDGTVEFLGRIDHQVKVRGYRIELGEIEALLRQQPSIDDAVVIVREYRPGDERLTAYFTARDHQQTDEGALRNALKQALPDYMVPSAFIRIDAIPMTPNGKVDRKALPEPEGIRLADSEAFVTPATPTEEMVAAIFSEILNVEPVGASHSFFDLGGHSLLATQVVSRVRDHFQIELPLRELFRSPTVAQLAKQIEQLESSADIRLPELEKVNPDKPIPLSFSQQRLWFIDQLEPGSPYYNIPSAFEIKGQLDVHVLEESLNILIERHDSLRTLFTADNGMPVQKILPEMKYAVETISADNRENLENIIVDEARRPFDLSTGPLFRLRIVTISGTENILLLTMHHIISDGWSLEIFIKELVQLYLHRRNHKDFNLPELTFQFADYANWQQKWMHSGVLDTLSAFWEEQLRGCNTTLSLPISKPRPPLQSYHGAHLRFEWDTKLSTRILKYVKDEGVTLFMFMLAAFNTLLYRYSGQDDINIGTPVANRNRTELERIIGFFVNTLIMRTDLSGNPPFKEVLNGVKEYAIRAFAHQEMPFEKLVEMLQPERDLSHTPLFQVMFVMQSGSKQTIETTELQVKPLDIENRISQFDLTLIVSHLPDRLSGAIEFNTDLFDTSMIQQMIEHFKIIVQSVIHQPEIAIDRINLIDPDTTKKVLREWNHTETSFTGPDLIHKQFESRVNASADAPAILWGERRLSYAELDQAAGRLANYLIRKGLRTEDRIGISIERSPELITGLLAILKAGGAYVPLDPGYPEERIKYILNDSDIRFILTQDTFRDLYSNEERLLICIDSDMEAINNEDVVLNVSPAVHPSNAAYVIYTSGSTGMPKGVVVTHASVTNHNRAVASLFDLKDSDRVLQFATINFDAAGEEIYPTLNTGALLVLRESETLLSGGELFDLVREQDITVLDLPTAYWHQVVMEMKELTLTVPDSLRLLVLGGDTLSPGHLRIWQEFTPEGIKLINTYGPTETTIVSTAYTIDAIPGKADNPPEVPIGKPIANTQTYILDHRMQPVPFGIPGELYIGGKGLARAYLNRPDLTAASFVPNPFAEKPGERLYRTGDLVCYRADGNIDFVGRIDDQVKIRGFRIETGEIESALLKHELLKDVKVLAISDKKGPKRLVAYCIPGNRDQKPDALLLRDFLKKQLPDYMIPSAFMTVDAFSYTPSGKIDKRSLPGPEELSPAVRTAYVKPETGTQQILADIWQELLGVKKVGINDNFFELGGDSILTIQVIAKARRQGLHITPVQMFNHQTIGQLAAVCQAAPAIKSDQGTVTGKVPLTPIQHWFFEQPFQDRHHWNQSLMLAVQSNPDPGILRNVVKHLLAHHDALRMFYTMEDATWHQEIAGVPQEVPFEHHDLSGLPGEKQRKHIGLIAEEAQRSIPIATGPLMKVIFFQLGSNDSRILIIVHHLAMDGVSWRILLEDFQAAYQALSENSGVQLPPKTSSFKQWAEKLQPIAESEDILKEKTFWSGMAERPLHALVTDFIDKDNSEAVAENAAFTLDQKLTTDLLRDVPATYKTQINDILLTALLRAWSVWQGKRSLFVLLEGHGRENLFEDTDISRTIGWFTTLFPVFLDLKQTIEPGDSIKSVKEQLRRIPNNGIGFGILRYLSGDKALKEQLRVLDNIQITFNYLGQFDQAVSGSSLFRPAPEDRGTERNLHNSKGSLLDITGFIHRGCLSMGISYSRRQFRTSTIQSFLDIYKKELTALIVHCKDPGAGGYTASDFKLAKLDDKKLDKVLSKISKKKK